VNVADFDLALDNHTDYTLAEDPYPFSFPDDRGRSHRAERKLCRATDADPRQRQGRGVGVERVPAGVLATHDRTPYCDM